MIDFRIHLLQVDAPKEVDQSDKVEAVPTAEELEIKSVEVQKILCPKTFKLNGHLNC